jgi:hypothetical protein
MGVTCRRYNGMRNATLLQIMIETYKGSRGRLGFRRKNNIKRDVAEGGRGFIWLRTESSLG